jgi:hypothetical protein
MTDPHPILFEDIAQALADLQDQVNGIQADLQTTPVAPPKDPLPQPRRWADRTDPDTWAALIDWIDNLIADYTIIGNNYITPCWPAHPGVVEELAGLWRAWTAAVTADEAANAGSMDLAEWHERCLWPCLRRLQSNQYTTIECLTAGEHKPSAAVPQLTDRALVPLPVGTP